MLSKSVPTLPTERCYKAEWSVEIASCLLLGSLSNAECVEAVNSKYNVKKFVNASNSWEYVEEVQRMQSDGKSKREAKTVEYSALIIPDIIAGQCTVSLEHAVSYSTPSRLKSRSLQVTRIALNGLESQDMYDEKCPKTTRKAVNE